MAEQKKPKNMSGDIPTLQVSNPSLGVNPSLKTVHVDTVEIFSNTNNMFFLRFFSRLPGINLEEARVCMNIDLLDKMIDLCSEAKNNLNNLKKKNTKK